jgi:Leucine-rich repeat (LRR) protein
MKKTLLILSLLFWLGSIHSQIVTIPDANFKAYLVGNTAINTNMDTEIQLSEASAFSGGIYCNDMSINDLTGIEAFTALTVLYCYGNQLTSLNISSNTALMYLSCNSNQLTTLDVSNNAALIELQCPANQLTTLDVSNNTSLTNLTCTDNLLTSINVSNGTLTDLFCRNNQLATLDVSDCDALSKLNFKNNQVTNINLSSNTVLTQLDCSYNQLSNLDVSANAVLDIIDCRNNQLTALNVNNNNNSNFIYFGAINNPSLTCIEVDDATYSTTNWTNIDSGASFSENCSGNLGVNNMNQEMLLIYPNPTSDVITVSGIDKISAIRIYDIDGSLLSTSSESTVSLNGLTSGVYLVEVESGEVLLRKRVVKE